MYTLGLKFLKDLKRNQRLRYHLSLSVIGKRSRLQITFVFGDHIRKRVAPNVVQIAKMLLGATMFCLTSFCKS
ncbi:hypothetical protein L2E82_16991 [Cichorium intybus]|uniref:Uncharacterized protein n=1 Tax=Cichorium intybus TaxID=13427 RepID=A0ACB9F716_CICIN|nr:hypothetical protein L2E82_16991 [Cichorium intybus]